MSVFDASYAECYDLLYADKDYAAEAAYVSTSLRTRSPQARTVLELGCGTGGHAEHLARLGWHVHGVDLSAEMIDRAQVRRATLPPDVADRLQFSVGDARSVRVGRFFDAVISLFHVMSYQTSNADLQAVYGTAAAHLMPGGTFGFDYWFGPAVLMQQPGVRIRRLENDRIRVLRIAEPTQHPQRNGVDVHYTLIVEDRATGRLSRYEECHPVRYLFVPELSLVEANGWLDAQNRAWMSPDADPDVDTWGAWRLVSRC